MKTKKKPKAQDTLLSEMSWAIPVRDCHGLPWGFPGQPTPVPVKTHTPAMGRGFHGYGCG